MVKVPMPKYSVTHGIKTYLLSSLGERKEKKAKDVPFLFLCLSEEVRM